MLNIDVLLPVFDPVDDIELFLLEDEAEEQNNSE